MGVSQASKAFRQREPSQHRCARRELPPKKLNKARLSPRLGDPMTLCLCCEMIRGSIKL